MDRNDKTYWLPCRISPGAFSDEFAVSGTLFDDKQFSLFAYREDLELPDSADIQVTVEGAIRVDPVNKQGELWLVRLPRPTLENGQTVTVRASTLHATLARQPA